MSKEVGEKKLPTREGVIFLLYKDGKVLLEDRKHPKKAYFGYTIIPGGTLEKEIDNDFETAAKREILEESGVIVRKMMLLDTFLHTTISGNLYNTSAFLITEYGGEVKNMEGKSNHLWVSLEEADNLVEFAESKYIILLAKNVLNDEGLIKD